MNKSYRIRFISENNYKRYSDELAHYGIKGQKWGVRRFQNPDGTYTAAGKERYANTGVSPTKVRLRDRSAVAAANNIDRMGKEDLSKKVDRNKTKQGDTTEAKQRVALDIVATLVNPINAAYLLADGALAASASHKTNSYFRKRAKNSTLDEKTGLYMKHDGEYSEKQDLSAVNPGFRNFNSNTKNNCMLCTTTYDMRKRGYDVTAQLDSEGYNFGDLKRWYPKAKVEKSTRINADGSVMKRKEYVQNTINAIQKQGNGARGNLMVWFRSGWDGSGGGGHSMIYEVQNGKVIIKDGQTGRTYKNPMKIFNMTDASSFARLDNIKPDLDRIKEECVR